MSDAVFTHKEIFKLENGEWLPQLHLAYHYFGELNATGTNVAWVFHALTANSDPTEWWPGVVGNNCIINPTDYFIVCVNMPGSCYGSIAPTDINPHTQQAYLNHFPSFTTRDMIRSYELLRNHLGIHKIEIGIGGSMGGQQLLEWAIEAPNLFNHIIPIATNAQHSQWGIAYNESQRWAIEQDPSWLAGTENDGKNGLQLARSIALLSYRNYTMYNQTAIDNHKNAISYQRYQGKKLADRFNAYSYWFLSKSMDAHNIGRERVSVVAALQNIRAKTLVIAIESDELFPVQEQAFLAQNIPASSLSIIPSSYGHDGFLLEYKAINDAVSNFLSSWVTYKHPTNHPAE